MLNSLTRVKISGVVHTTLCDKRHSNSASHIRYNADGRCGSATFLKVRLLDVKFAKKSPEMGKSTEKFGKRYPPSAKQYPPFKLEEGGFRPFPRPPIRPQYPSEKCGFHHLNPPIRQQICGFRVRHPYPHPHADSGD
uniref:Uncharacterized protein n=1 Tax=Romanomermis culicivorax TaxID=13658 RepID=A0A915HTG0_ROMCU